VAEKTTRTSRARHALMTVERRRPRRRRTAVALLVAAAVLGVLAASLIGAVLSVRRDLELGRSAIERGRHQLAAGEVQAAAGSFRKGRNLLSSAAERANGLGVRAVGWLPVLGRTSDAVRAVATSATTAADGAIVLTDAIASVPGGFAGLAPTSGMVRMEGLIPLGDAARRADVLMDDAAARLERATDSLVLEPVARALRDAKEEISEIRDGVHALTLILDGLPRFLGADGRRTYFFGAQNPAELRGTGGLIGAYSLLRIDDGRFRFSPFEPIQSLAQPSLTDVPSPNGDYAAYEQFRRHGLFWTGINVMPDFPSVAQAILASYEAATDTRLDGVVIADPFALSALLDATGPVEVLGYGIRIDADTVVPFTTNEAYSVFKDSNTRKRILGDVARAAFGRFLNQPSTDTVDLRALIDAVSDGHILVYSPDDSMQEGLAATPIGGALRLPQADDDLLSVVVNSGAGSKVDFFQQRDVMYAVQLHDDGSARAQLDLTLTNHAPTSGEPRYVIGPFPQRAPYFGPILRRIDPGESVALSTVYCGTDCMPVEGEAELEGTPVDVQTGVDLGVRYLRHYYAIPSGERRELRLVWDDPAAWDGNTSGGVFRLTFANQVTVRPATLGIRIEPPAGMDITSVTIPLTVRAGAAVYNGEAGRRLDVEVEVGPSLLVRLWRNTLRFLETPVFDL
jgi:Protein of unknown function (DUF4012)